jgi:hypothetical protein
VLSGVGGAAAGSDGVDDGVDPVPQLVAAADHAGRPSSARLAAQPDFTGRRLFTGSGFHLPRAQQYKGYLFERGGDQMAGIFGHGGNWAFGWYAVRKGPYEPLP